MIASTLLVLLPGLLLGRLTPEVGRLAEAEAGRLAEADAGRLAEAEVGRLAEVEGLPAAEAGRLEAGVVWAVPGDS